MAGYRAVMFLATLMAPPGAPSFRFQPGQSFLMKLEFKTRGTVKGTSSEITALYEAVADVSKDGAGLKLTVRFERFSKQSSGPGLPTQISLWSASGLKQVQDGRLVRNVPGEKDEHFEMFRRPLLSFRVAAKADLSNDVREVVTRALAD